MKDWWVLWAVGRIWGMSDMKLTENNMILCDNQIKYAVKFLLGDKSKNKKQILCLLETYMVFHWGKQTEQAMHLSGAVVVYNELIQSRCSHWNIWHHEDP